VVTVALEDTTYPVSEDAGFVQIKLVLNQPSCVPIRINVQPRIHAFGDPNNIASGKYITYVASYVYMLYFLRG